MTAAEKVTTKIQSIVGLEEVPAEKFGGMLLRTVTGVLFIALGGFLLWFMVKVFHATQAMSMPLLIGGAAALVFGAHIASRELVGKSMRSLAEPLQILKGLLKPKAGGDDAL